LAAGSSYPEISLTTNVASDAPAALTNSASVSGGGEANTGNNTASDPTTVAPISAATAKITPTSATCTQFANGTAAELSGAVYTVWYNRIWSISPSEFLYYIKIVAPATTFQVGVLQSNTNNWSALSVSRANVYKANCTSQSATITTGTTPSIRVNNATVGAAYYIAVRYRLSSLLYRTVTSPYPTVTYTLLATLNNVEVNTSRASVIIRP
jgi:hypothetical protein